MFTSRMSLDNHEVDNLITSHVSNQRMDPIAKTCLLLKMCFTHCLIIESSENIHKLCKCMTGRTTRLGCGRLNVASSHDNASSRNHIETHSCFDQLLFRGFVGVVTELLLSYNEFCENFNFHNNSLGCSIH